MINYKRTFEIGRETCSDVGRKTKGMEESLVKRVIKGQGIIKTSLGIRIILQINGCELAQ